MWSTLAADLRATVDETQHGGIRYWVRVVGKALVTPQVQAVVLFRVGHALARTPLRPLAFMLRSVGLTLSGAELHPDATIGPGLALVHSNGVVIGHGVVVGEGCRISQGVTLGEPGRGGGRDKWGFPTVGDHVTLGVHAVVLGPHHLGDYAVIGANSVATGDIPAKSIAVGAPAKVVRELDMDDWGGRG